MFSETDPCSARILRHCDQLLEVATLGTNCANGLENILLSGSPDNFSRLELGGGLDFLRYLELDLQHFADGDEFRPGIEICNRATIMAKVFRIKNLQHIIVNNNSRTTLVLNRRFEEAMTILTLGPQVLDQIFYGLLPPKRELRRVWNFIQKKSAGYEDVAHKARIHTLQQAVVGSENPSVFN